MRRAVLLTAGVIALAAAGGCGGGAPNPAAAAGATAESAGAMPGAAPGGAAGGAVEAPADDGHLCARKIDRPALVVPHYHAVRELPPEEIRERCGFAFVEAMARWGGPPTDLLAIVVDEAREDEGALAAWVRQRAERDAETASRVVAADIAATFAVGGDPRAPAARAAWWEGKLAGAPDGGGFVARAVAEGKALPALLERVHEVHRLRCLIEVNPLGFAVHCKPLHPQGQQIQLRWRAGTRDGVLESLEIADCQGKSCGKLREGALKLVAAVRAVVADAEQLKTRVYRDRILTWLALPPLRGLGESY
jgi:hypothetical protein